MAGYQKVNDNMEARIWKGELRVRYSNDEVTGRTVAIKFEGTIEDAIKEENGTTAVNRAVANPERVLREGLATISQS